MGLSLSCPGDEFGVFDENLEALIVSSIAIEGEDVKRTLRSVSFNGREAEPAPARSFGSGKMPVEGSLSFNGREAHLDRAISVKAPTSTGIADEAMSTSSRCSKSPVERVSFDPDVGSGSPKHKAAVQLQKVYKSFRTRRRLADCAVLVEQRWWKLLDFAVLKRSSVSFFGIGKEETAISRWSRARTRAAKVGKGLLNDEKARKLALQHWLEAIDPRHRYGHNLNFYYDSWLNCDSRQPFFYWLDVGEGRDYNLDECPRTKLQQQCIKYLGPKEREAYEVIVENGKFLYKQSRQFLDTSEETKDTKWIFVLSTLKKLYVGQKKKGTFQHSSFLAGGATSAAGRLEVEKGVLKAVWPHSGHYRPTEENFQEFISFLKENYVDLTDVKNSPTDEEEASLMKQRSFKSSLRRDPTELDLIAKSTQFARNESITDREKLLKPSSVRRRKDVTISIPDNTHVLERLRNEARYRDESSSSRSSMSSPLSPKEPTEKPSPSEGYMSPKWNLFEEDQEEDQEVPQESILRRIISKKGMKSYQLGRQLPCKWTTGAGPRIGCVRDYPIELQSEALEKLNLSPRSSGPSRTCSSPHITLTKYSDSYPSPRHIITSGSGSSRAYSSPRCLNCPSPLSLSKERSNSFHKSYSIQC